MAAGYRYQIWQPDTRYWIWQPYTRYWIWQPDTGYGSWVFNNKGRMLKTTRKHEYSYYKNNKNAFNVSNPCPVAHVPTAGQILAPIFSFLSKLNKLLVE